METPRTPEWHQPAGVVLALSSGFFIGSSLILQKRGLLDTEAARCESGNEYEYLKSKLWWVGICCSRIFLLLILVVLGELCNFGAYAFSPAIIVTPLGAVSVVISAILSFLFLGEKLNYSGAMGILLCIIGSVLIILHAPPSSQTETIPEFFSYVLSPGFLIYTGLAIVLMCYLVFRMGPLYGKTQPIVYLSITSLGGAFLVNGAQGFGSSVVYSISHPEDSQFLQWPIYPLMAFVLGMAIFQINYLNKSLQYFSASLVTPVNYVFFSTATLVTSAVLFRGFNVTTTAAGVSIVLGFCVIVIGVSLLFQYNLKLNKLARAREEAANEAALAGGGSLGVQASQQTLAESRLSMSDPRTDVDPVTLWAQTFPLRSRHPRRSPSGFELAMSQSYPVLDVGALAPALSRISPPRTPEPKEQSLPDSASGNASLVLPLEHIVRVQNDDSSASSAPLAPLTLPRV
ncbi:hypothetical protein HDU91_006720 [Kappamyces sp. JEL0680]|nr:hypothetical protein HDU91_006720 [Kappamyces sp. JEL0680]